MSIEDAEARERALGDKLHAADGGVMLNCYSLTLYFVCRIFLKRKFRFYFYFFQGREFLTFLLIY